MRRVAGVLIGVLIAEVLVRVALFVPQVRRPLTEGTGPAGAELRWLYAWYEHGDMAQFEADPALGWRLSRAALGSTDAAMTVGEEGARVPAPPRARAPGALRVAAYGDSFAFGWDVDDAQSWHAQLMAMGAAAGRAIEVVNLGVPGYDLGQVVLRREAESEGWAPDVEVLILHEILGQRSIEPFEHYQRPMLRAELGERIPQGVPVPSVDEMAVSLMLTPHLWTLARVGALRMQGGAVARYEPEAGPRARALVDRFVDDVVSDGHTPLIVWLELPHAVQSGTSASPWMPRCASPGKTVRCLDTRAPLQALAASGDPLVAGTHYDAAGNRVLAEVVLEGLSGL
jgi:hypothetical protein